VDDFFGLLRHLLTVIAQCTKHSQPNLEKWKLLVNLYLCRRCSTVICSKNPDVLWLAEN